MKRTHSRFGGCKLSVRNKSIFFSKLNPVQCDSKKTTTKSYFSYSNNLFVSDRWKRMYSFSISVAHLPWKAPYVQHGYRGAAWNYVEHQGALSPTCKKSRDSSLMTFATKTPSIIMRSSVVSQIFQLWEGLSTLTLARKSPLSPFFDHAPYPALNHENELHDRNCCSELSSQLQRYEKERSPCFCKLSERNVGPRRNTCSVHSNLYLKSGAACSQCNFLTELQYVAEPQVHVAVSQLSKWPETASMVPYRTMPVFNDFLHFTYGSLYGIQRYWRYLLCEKLFA